jgi:hypothetical protein
MKGIYSTGAPLVHVPGWVDGWMGGSKSGFKDCLQQSKKYSLKMVSNNLTQFFTQVTARLHPPPHTLFFTANFYVQHTI